MSVINHFLISLQKWSPVENMSKTTTHVCMPRKDCGKIKILQETKKQTQMNEISNTMPKSSHDNMSKNES